MLYGTLTKDSTKSNSYEPTGINWDTVSTIEAAPSHHAVPGSYGTNNYNPGIGCPPANYTGSFGYTGGYPGVGYQPMPGGGCIGPGNPGWH